jgi:hypothetical protein
MDPDRSHRPLWPVLALAFFTLVASPFLVGGPFGRGVVSALIGLTAVMALLRSGATRAVTLGGEIGLVAATIVSIIARNAGEPDDWMTIVSTAIFCLLLLVTPLVIVLRMTQRPKITLDTVAGLLAAYIQFGMFFAALYEFIALVTGDPFFQGTAADGYMDYQFFSFTTLTTLGYGNLVPRGEVGQTLAVVEAILGQVFLVTVVALAVSNLGAAVPRRRIRSGGPVPDEEPTEAPAGGADATAPPA